MADFRPHPFLNGSLLSINDCFTFKRSGLQTKRDEFVYSASKTVLTKRIAAFTTATDKRAAAQFHDSRDRQWSTAKGVAFSESHIKDIAYRPLDQRFLYNHKSLWRFPPA